MHEIIASRHYAIDNQSINQTTTVGTKVPVDLVNNPIIAIFTKTQ